MIAMDRRDPPRHRTFDAVAVLHRSGVASVWAARPVDQRGGPAEHCLKRVPLAVAVPPGQGGHGDPADAARDLLAAATLQHAMGLRSAGWAPVHAFGTDGDAAYVVTDRYARSAQTLIDRGRRLTSGQLRTLLVAVVDALIELHVSRNRGHGNLKPSNVMIGPRLRAGEVHLTDPAPTGEQVASLTRAPDPKAVGRLLFALVTRRPYTAAQWPLRHGVAWATLGSSGRAWFDLCASLLHPRNADAADLDELMTRLVAIRPSRRRLRRAAVLIPAAAACAAAALYAGRQPLKHFGLATGRDVADMVKDFTTTPPPRRRPWRHAKPATRPASVVAAATPHPTTAPAVLTRRPMPVVGGGPVPTGLSAYPDRPRPTLPTAGR